MKRLFPILLLLLLTASTACAQSWKSDVVPAAEIASSRIVKRVESSPTLFTVGVDVPAGLYRITHGYIGANELLPALYGLIIYSGAQPVYENIGLNTATNADLVFYVETGDTFAIVICDTDVVFLSSVDDRVFTVTAQ